MKNFAFISGEKIYFLFCLVGFILLLTVFWIVSKFGNPSYEQILFHIVYQSGGSIDFDKSLIKSFLLNVGFFSVFFSFALYYVRQFILKRSINMVYFGFVKFILLLLPIALIFYAVSLSYVKFGGDTGYGGYVGAGQFVTFNPKFSNKLSERDPNYFANNYVDPKKVNLNISEKKNLILIYVESFEKSYENKNIFGLDLTSELSKQGVGFSNFAQVPGTGWTIAGIVASQCAVPLKVVFMKDGNNQANGNSFMRNAECLGDTLKKVGYKNIFLNGPSLNFAGVYSFLRTHGYDEMYGKDEWLKEGKYSDSDFNYWGLNDDDLFREAKLKLDGLIAKDELFNLTILTVNTHGPDGFLSKTCKNAGGKSFEDIVSCTAKEISDFISYVKSQKYDANTNIVVLGDHLSIPNPVIEKLKNDPKRSIYSLFVSKSELLKSRDEIIHFDFAPSILDISGIQVIGSRYGLGYSAFQPAKTQPPATRVDDMNRDLLNISPKYMSLW